MNSIRQPNRADVLPENLSPAARVARKTGFGDARSIRLALGMGIAMLLMSFALWQPTAAVGAPGEPVGSPVATGQQAADPAAPDGALRLTAATTLTLFSGSPNPSVFGQTVSWGYSLSIGGACTSPTGTISLREGTTVLDTKAIGVPLSYSGLSAAVHTTINAIYNGDANCDADTSPNITQTVNKANTSTSLSSSMNPAPLCDLVTFTANVTAVSPGSGTPTGTVTFKDGAIPIGVDTLDGSGQATFSTAILTKGSHSITAEYNGDSNFNTSVSSALTQAVNKGNVTTTLTKDPDPTMFGQYVVLTATVGAAAGCGLSPPAWSPSATAASPSAVPSWTAPGSRPSPYAI